MALQDHNVIIQVLGSLIKNPQFLSESDKYNLTPNDFYFKLDKYIFMAIENLYRNGALKIQPIDIENALSTNETAKLLLKQQNGIEYLQDAEYFAQVENFPYYYRKLKKFNLLETLQSKGIDISEFYIQDPLNPKAMDTNAAFEELELEDIINEEKKKIALIEGQFVDNSDIESWDIAAELDEVIDNFGTENVLGLPINGECVTQVINGAELGALTIRSGATGTGKSRYAVGDACKLAYPFSYNWDSNKWEPTGFTEQVLFVCTEQRPDQIIKMILAYLSGINESKFKYGTFTAQESKVLSQAQQLIKDYDNLHLMRIPDPTVGLIKTMVRQAAILHDVKYCFFDYIFASGGLYKEFRGNNLRTDEALLLLSTALKDIAIELNISVFTSTQLNAKGDDNKEIRNESALAGSRAIANKCDNGLIIARPTKEELEFFDKENFHLSKVPNRVIDVYKTRSSAWNYIRIWCYFDGGTCRNTDLFVTDNRMNIINDFFENEYTVNWEMDSETCKYIERLNHD